MKKLRPLLHFAPVLLALVVLIAPPALRAEESSKEKPLSKTKEKYDADRDGKLSEEESAAAKEGSKAKSKATREANLAKYDANKDGKLDESEKASKAADEQAARDAKKAAKGTGKK